MGKQFEYANVPGAANRTRPHTGFQPPWDTYRRPDPKRIVMIAGGLVLFNVVLHYATKIFRHVPATVNKEYLDAVEKKMILEKNADPISRHKIGDPVKL